MSLDQPTGRQPDHPVASQFPARWSPRAFTDRSLAESEVMSLLEAARWAPSASNHQPWRLVWARRGEAAMIAEVPDAVPLGLLDGARMVRSVESGQTLTWADVELREGAALNAALALRDRVAAGISRA